MHWQGRLFAWDELDAMLLLPASLRYRIEQPTLEREQLKDLQVMLVDVLRELDLRYERG